jgi:cation transport protein ChaC
MLLADLQLSDEAARSVSLDELFAAAPFDVARDGLWLFVYGILAADPPFRFVERRTALMEGRQRRFVLADPMNRGTPEAPGLVLGLEPGGSCSGLAYRIAPSDSREALAAVWRQEMALPF